MSWTFVACVGIAFAWLGLFYLWGRGFLTLIKAEQGLASSIAFGYLVLQFLYQIIYLPFYFTRGSYRALTYTWLSIVLVFSVFLIVFLQKKRTKRRLEVKLFEKVGICLAAVLVFALAWFISLHVPFYGQDTRVYISKMNESIYRDSIWINEGELHFHYGMCSMFQFFTTPSLFTGIKPYYISLFTVRIVGVSLFSLIAYRTGKALFQKGIEFCWSAVALSVLAPYLLMFWGSNYTAEFFYWRIYEAKGFGQFILFPIAFSVFLEMFRQNTDRKVLWKKQMLVGLSAVAVSASSLTPYIFFLLMGTLALLIYDKLKNGWKTVGCSIACALPNLIYLVVYILEKQSLIVL